ncbi:MAG: amidophosphoribosyltransferase [Bacteroidaceae bacterium]|nr:amidophosphoribosyltransferase [Bacteroidaceae bacterium]
MEQLKHECGVAVVRLLKPLAYYQQKYGTWRWGLNKLYLLMEKQHNRGQEGAGLACVKLSASPGNEYMFRERALGSGAISEIFGAVGTQLDAFSKQDLSNTEFAVREIPFAGEILMGHLRYSTTGRSGLSYVHPFLRRNNWRAKNLCLCGNFNMTNTDEIFADITSKGQHPRIPCDTYIMLEQVGHRLDRESERLFKVAYEDMGLEGMDITNYIEENIDVNNVLRTAAPIWDGGYVICGAIGSGEFFSMRDPWGIRPAFWYANDEVMVLASERPVIQTAFDLDTDDINELEPGQSIVVSKRGRISLTQILPPAEKLSPCSFERIYFSRGSDRDIYRERKALGSKLIPNILKAIDDDIENSVFSFIPNTAEVAFCGMLEGMKTEYNKRKIDELLSLDHVPTREELEERFSRYVRSEKVAIKDIKLRTFISEENGRNDLAAHVYDITYGCLRQGMDNLVIIDDSIVRGTTLRESIIRILDRLHPKKIVIVSSAPQVRYPDYYGIDMACLEGFIAFRAAIALLEDTGRWDLIVNVYKKCVAQRKLPKEQLQNYVKEIYAPFTVEEVSAKMVELLRPTDITTPIELVFQSIEGLRETCPEHSGDWYFSGDYPTPGGLKLLNEAYIRYYESR